MNCYIAYIILLFTEQRKHDELLKSQKEAVIAKEQHILSEKVKKLYKQYELNEEYIRKNVIDKLCSYAKDSTCTDIVDDSICSNSDNTEPIVQDILDPIYMQLKEQVALYLERKWKASQELMETKLMDMLMEDTFASVENSDATDNEFKENIFCEELKLKMQSEIEDLLARENEVHSIIKASTRAHYNVLDNIMGITIAPHENGLASLTVWDDKVPEKDHHNLMENIKAIDEYFVAIQKKQLEHHNIIRNNVKLAMKISLNTSRKPST